MTATDELRRLLDERGVEWAEPTMKPNTTWFPDAYGINCRVKPWGDALCVKRYGLTPAQAIDATLGRGTCHAVFEVDAMSEDDRIGEFVCSECGETFGGGRDQLPHYCPACGKRVVE